MCAQEGRRPTVAAIAVVSTIGLLTGCGGASPDKVAPSPSPKIVYPSTTEPAGLRTALTKVSCHPVKGFWQFSATLTNPWKRPATIEVTVTLLKPPGPNTAKVQRIRRALGPQKSSQLRVPRLYPAGKVGYQCSATASVVTAKR